jgi:CRP/FNR family cyclic AMP-dependent transcriptional regulator
MRMNPTLERLSSLPLFADCDRRELAAVANRTTTIRAKKGDVLMREGAIGRELAIIVTGAARVVRDDGVVATLGPGDVVGEMALLDRRPRSATVVADSDMIIEVSTPREFAEMLSEVPRLAPALLRQMTGRLRKAMTTSA